MHESSMMKNILATVRHLEKENAPKKVAGITIELPTFGSLSEEHFRFHFKEATKQTPWKGLFLEIVKVPFGIDAKFSHVTLRDRKSPPRKKQRLRKSL